jgi:CheY-like chemotaxis protein
MQGALAFLTKPVTKEALDTALGDLKRFIKRRVKKLLVVEDDEAQRNSIIALIGNGASEAKPTRRDVKTSAVSTGAEALAALKRERFDCMVLDLGLSDMTGFQLIEEIKKEPRLRELPIIVYTGRELTRKEETQLKRVAESIIIKGVQSPERLLDETTLFLHRVAANLPAPQRQMLEKLHPPGRSAEFGVRAPEGVRNEDNSPHSALPDPLLAGKRVLVVDDDIRNLFAMTSVLERFNMEVITAENGNDAIDLLNAPKGSPDQVEFALVLMDIMMPEMDGFNTLRAIRNINRLKSLPIIVVTAKAMKGDREKCLQAGASDYISKPLNPNDLLALIRKWLQPVAVRNNGK